MVYGFGTFRFDSAQGLLFRGESLVPLNQKSLCALAVLLEHHGRLVTKEDLISAIWPDTFVEENNLSQCISNLRQALGDGLDRKQYIQTVVRKGFCFVAPVTVLDPETGFRGSGSRIRESASGNGDPGFGTRDSGLGIRGPGIETRANQTDSKTPHPNSPTPLPSPPAPGEGRGERAIEERSAPQDGPQHRGAPSSPEVVGRDGLTWRGWRRALWIGFAVCTISLLVYILWPRREPQVLGFTQLTNDGCSKYWWLPLLTDGDRVYFWEKRRAGLVLASVPIDGGDVAELPVPKDFVPTDVSKYGSEFLGVESEQGGAESVAVLSTSRESLRWLLKPPDPAGLPIQIWGGSWSPDGNRIVFPVRSDLFEAKINGRGVRQVAHLDGWPSWPRWSPDGKSICFSVLDPKAERFRLWQLNSDGTRLHPLSFPGIRFTETRYGAWTPDGRYLTFEAEEGGRYDIWAVRERGGPFWAGEPKPVRLTSGPLNYHSPIPCRDGKEILVFGEESRGELMRFDVKSHSFVDFLGGISAAEVDFSRDGQWVAYVTYPDYTLWRARSDGSDALQLTFPPLKAREPHWSPDGQQIAFQGISPDTKYKIYLVASSGGLVREAVPGNGEESVGTWWPDGRSLLYDEPLYRHDISQMFIYRLNLKTGKSYRIPGSAGMWTARLSPDGRYTASLDATPTAGPHHLFVLETAAGRRIVTITMPEPLHEPTWSRDGNYVYFATTDPPAPALYRIRVRDKKLERLTSLKGFPVAGLWTGVAPDGSPLVLRDISTEEIYALRVRLP